MNHFRTKASIAHPRAIYKTDNITPHVNKEKSPQPPSDSLSTTSIERASFLVAPVLDDRAHRASDSKESSVTRTPSLALPSNELLIPRSTTFDEHDDHLNDLCVTLEKLTHRSLSPILEESDETTSTKRASTSPDSLRLNYFFTSTVSHTVSDSSESSNKKRKNSHMLSPEHNDRHDFTKHPATFHP